MGPRRKPTTVVLLKEHSHNMKPNDALLHTDQRFGWLTWEKLLLAVMEVNPETHKWTVYRV